MTMPPDVNAVARWMADTVAHDGFLDQEDAVDAIDEAWRTRCDDDGPGRQQD